MVLLSKFDDDAVDSVDLGAGAALTVLKHGGVVLGGVGANGDHFVPEVVEGEVDAFLVGYSDHFTEKS